MLFEEIVLYCYIRRLLYMCRIILQVEFNEATATLMDAPEVQFITDNDTSDIQKCLITKWPTLNIKWKSASIPSIQ